MTLKHKRILWGKIKYHGRIGLAVYRQANNYNKAKQEGHLSFFTLAQGACLTHLLQKDKGSTCHVMSDAGH